jgi:cold shock CspA family protein
VQYQATLKFLNRERGYGLLITPSGENHFVHVRDLEASQINPNCLKDGETRLSYSLEQDSRNQKLKAVDIRILD